MNINDFIAGNDPQIGDSWLFSSQFANVLLYSRSFSSFLCGGGVFILFENQLVINYF